MATAAKKQFGSKVATRIAAKDKLPKPALAQTADKTSVPVKKPATKRATRATPASQTGLVNDPAGAAAKAVVTTQKIDIPADKPAPKGRAAKKQALFDKANAVPDPAAKVATPSTVKRVSRSNKIAKTPNSSISGAHLPSVKAPLEKSITERVADDIRATPAKKVAKPKVPSYNRSGPTAKDGMIPPPLPLRALGDIAPAAKKAIKKAADALKAPVLPKTEVSVTEEAKNAHALMEEFDAVVKKIRAAGGGLNGDMTIGGVVFKYRETPAKKPTKAQLKAKHMSAISRLIDDAKQDGLYPSIIPSSTGTLIKLEPFVAK